MKPQACCGLQLARRLSLPAVLMFLLGWMAASCRTAQTSVDYARDVDFRSYRTYSWRARTESDNEIMEERIINAVDRELQTKGLRRVSSGGDLAVIYYLSFDRRLNIYSYDYLYGPYWNGHWDGESVIREIPEGKLVVDLIDSGKNQLVWRGIGSNVLTNANAAGIQALVDDVTHEMFRRYPPDQ